MPADSTTIYQEGLVIPPTRIALGDRFDENVLALVLANVRQPDLRLGDLRAQLAAGRLGAERVVAYAAGLGSDALESRLDAVLAYSERRVRSRIAELPDGVYRAVDYLEDPQMGEVPLVVTVAVTGDGMTIDFAGTAPQVPGNLNAPLAVTRSAVAFALRALLDPYLPANDGAMAPVTLVVPEGCVLAARPPAAVVAGNVETSQRVADLLFLALGEATAGYAQGQGTMNNLILGNSRFSYYETIGGGQGAGPTGPGLDGVHVGMSNTLNTPIEALELEYPLRVRHYGLRDDSGGRGVHRGGFGIVRTVEVLEDCTLSILSDRRKHQPQGAAGGGAGAAGNNLLNNRPIPAKTSQELKAGDRVRIETPGAGGWGASKPRSS
jgi:N-methylhydantoinase B